MQYETKLDIINNVYLIIIENIHQSIMTDLIDFCMLKNFITYISMVFLD